MLPLQIKTVKKIFKKNLSERELSENNITLYEKIFVYHNCCCKTIFIISGEALHQFVKVPLTSPCGIAILNQ